MKMRLFACVVVAAFVVTSCSKVAVNEEPVVEETPTPEAVSTPVATPAPVAELAPEGVFYLLAAARVETADGIHGLTPGTGVKLLRPGVYLTPYGEASLDASQVTNDLAAARAARDADRTAQMALQQRKAIPASVAAAQTKADTKETGNTQEAALKQIERERAEKLLDRLEAQSNQLEQQVSALRRKQQSENYGRTRGRSEASTTERQLAAAREQLSAVNKQIVELTNAAAR